MTYTFRPQGVCSQRMEITVEDNKLTELKVIGGCSGNLQGISALVRGMDIDEIIEKLGGIRCGGKRTSCPDQLAEALRRIREDHG